MENEDDVSSTQRRMKSDGYTYSWFLPAPGSNGSVVSPPQPASDPGNIAKVKSQEALAAESRIQRWQHQGEKGLSPTSPRSLGLNPTILRVGGLAAWSVIALTGATVLFSRVGPVPGTQLGVLGGVWVGISALIWFLPGKISNRG